MEKNIGSSFALCRTPQEADMCWDHKNPSSQPLALEFYESLQQEDEEISKKYFREVPGIFSDNHEKDAIASIFFMINCLQEYKAPNEQFDRFGRYKYESSYQNRFQIIQQNLVQQEIDAMSERLNLKSSRTDSNFFISHDIDTIYGSFMQDGFWALKNLNIGVIFNLLMYELAGKPHWRNIDRIIKINSEYDVRSTFFWLVNQGPGLHQVMNADYRIKQEQDLLQKVASAGFTNGLHKSSSEHSIDEELEMTGLENCNWNRYHFLKFKSHVDWRKISDSKLDFDASLGFAEHYGFRNSYGKAFQPFDIQSGKPYNFIEAPLNFMDGTFHKYMNLPRNGVARIIIDFFEKNKFNCNFSLLWHNTYFTDYKYHTFLSEYKKVMEFIYENKIQCVTPDELIKSNVLTW